METAVVADYKAMYEQQKARANALELTVSSLRHELAQIKKLIYGSRHERFVAAVASDIQPTLGFPIETIPAPPPQTQTVSYTKTITAPSKQVAHPGRSPLPASLRREEVIIEPDCIREGSIRIGEEITELLEFEPGELYVKKYVRPKYLMPQGADATRSEINIGTLPSLPLPKAIAGPGLISQVLIDKYQDHLPVYRQMQRFKRAGIEIAYSTITGWIAGGCDLLAPLYTALKQEVLSSGYVQADETPIKVLDDEKKGKSHRGYFWVYNNSPGGLVFFDYQEGRGMDGPQRILKGYQGYLQTDGYQVYESFESKDIILVGCMAHARRYFYDALENDAVRANYALGKIQELYAIEHLCKQEGIGDDHRGDLRARVAVPILNEFCIWMQAQYQQVLPQSPIGKALKYTLQRWDKLCVYTTNGTLCIDNNRVENSIRPVALGRKNYLFCGSHEAATRTGIIYSLLGTCKLHNVNPFAWLREILQVLPDWPVNKVSELLPHKWAARQNQTTTA